MATDSQLLDADPASESASDASPATLRRRGSIGLALCTGLALLVAGVFAARHDDLASALLILMAAVMIAGLLTANRALDQARQLLREERLQRAKLDVALRQSQGRE